MHPAAIVAVTANPHHTRSDRPVSDGEAVAVCLIFAAMVAMVVVMAASCWRCR